MGRTYTSLTYHLIFSTKYRLKTIRPEFRERLYHYIGGVIREKVGVLLEIGGIEDHIHIMAGIPPTILVSDMLKFIKSNSSGWVNDTIQPTRKAPHGLRRGLIADAPTGAMEPHHRSGELKIEES